MFTFLSSLASGLIQVLSLRWLDSRNVPEPTMTVNGLEHGCSISRKKAMEGFVLKLEILNKGVKSWNKEEGYFHIFINNELSPKLNVNSKHELTKRQRYPDYTVIHAKNPGPCLPKRHTLIDLVNCKLHRDSNVLESTIHYFFAAEFGNSPKQVVMNEMSSYGKLTIRFKDDDSVSQNMDQGTGELDAGDSSNAGTGVGGYSGDSGAKG